MEYTETLIKQPQEGVSQIQTVTSIDSDDPEAILTCVTKNISVGEQDMSKIIGEANENKKQYLGGFIPDDDYLDTDEKVRINHTFLSVETIVPIVTRRTPIANTFIFPRKPKNKQLQAKLNNYLRDLWQIEIQMQKELEKGVRQGLINRFAAFKIFYNEELERVDSRLIPSRNIIIPKVNDFDDLPYVAEYVDITYGEAVERYELDNDKKEELKNALKRDSKSNVTDETMFTLIEYWEDTKVVWKYKNIMLGYEDNPYYDFDDKGNNHFVSPHKPYVFFSFLRTGDSAVDETSFIEQTRTAQRMLNLRETQVNRALEENDSITVVNGGSRETAVNMTRKGTKVAHFPGADGSVSRVPTNLDIASFQRDQNYLTTYMDQLFGTLPTIRGQQDTAETATGRQILRESALTRQEIIHRNIEYMAQDWYNWAVQLIKMFYDSPQDIYSIPDDVDEWEEDYQLSKEDLKGTFVKILVKEGSTIPIDRPTQRAEAYDFYTSGLISAKDALDLLGYADSEKLARNAFLAQADPQSQFDELSGTYDPEAILHIKQIINGERGDGLDDLLETDDLEAMQEHIEVQAKYLQGIEVDENLPDVSTLEREALAMLYSHNKSEMNRLSALQTLRAQDMTSDVAISNDTSIPLQ